MENNGKRKILFVDDEPNVLQGLKRMLRRMRDEWDMEFAEGGQAALEILATKPFNIIVSDMRMPGMDGAQLLKEVSQRHPDIVRIILSGQSDRELIMRSVGPTHQFLSKPCDPDLLIAKVTRACSLRDLLSNPALISLVSAMESLPSLPSLYVEMMEEVKSPNPSLEKVGQIISEDMAMTAKVLQLVNSAFFYLVQPVTSPVHAANILGLDTISALVLSGLVFSQFKLPKTTKFSMDQFWKHSMTVGTFAEKLAKSEALEKEELNQALIGGMLHDLGKLIFLSRLPEKYLEVLSTAKHEGEELLETERELLSSTHCEVGAYLLGLWGLPDPIVEAVAYHHRPRHRVTDGVGVVTAVHVADAFDHETEDMEADETTSLLDPDYIGAVGLNDRVAEWRELWHAFTQEREEG